MRRRGSLGLIATGLLSGLLGGCFEDPPPIADGGSTLGTTDLPQTTAALTDGTTVGASTDASTDPDTTQGLTTSTSDPTTGGSSDSTGVIPIMCADGQVAPGELCLDGMEVIVPNSPVRSARLGDVQGNAFVDIVHLIFELVVIRDGLGDGNFGSQEFSESAMAMHLELGELDDDALLDVALLENDGTFSVLLRDPNTDTVSRFDSFATGPSPTAMGLGDMNGDGVLDAVATGGSPVPELFVRLNNGSGLMISPQTVGTTADVYDLAIADFDGDGAQDVVFSLQGNGWQGIALRPGNGDGTLGAQVQTPGQMVGARGVTAGDFNGDGDPDLAYVSVVNDNLSVLFNEQGSLGEPEIVSTNEGPIVVIAADLDADGADEIVVGHEVGQSILIYEADNRGNLVLATKAIPLTAPASALDTGDVNEDGALDVLVTVDTPNVNDLLVVLLSNP